MILVDITWGCLESDLGGHNPRSHDRALPAGEAGLLPWLVSNECKCMACKRRESEWESTDREGSGEVERGIVLQLYG